MAGVAGSARCYLRVAAAALSIEHVVIRSLTSTVVLAWLCACSTDTPPEQKTAQASSGSGAAAAAGRYDDSDCNLATVLDPEKPGAPGRLIESPRNPNGDSELAVLMRTMVDQLRENRLCLKNREAAKQMWAVHRVMRCAWPTNPRERNPGYDARAQVYLGTVRAFDEAPSQETYNAVVNGCIACHQVNCGGVIDFLRTLRWE